MSSGIPGPSLGNLFPKEYWGPFQPLAEKCENTIHISKIPEVKKFNPMMDVIVAWHPL